MWEETASMLLTHWGVRGSFPTPGPQTLRYGGHTSCLDVTNAAGQRCIIDAGTGLLELGARLREAGQTGGEHHILLSHCHWDHIQGLPFFAPVLDPTATLVIHGLQASTTELSDIIAGATRREFFPRDLGELRATFRFHAVEPGQPFAIPGFAVMPVRLNHPLGAVGYRLDADDTSFAYISDTAPFHECLHKSHFLRGLEPLTDDDRTALAKLQANLRVVLQNCDTVVYDTHFLPDEYERFPHYGHSTPDQALAVCHGIGVSTLVLFHHAPQHDDDTLDRMASHYAELGAADGIRVVTARDRLQMVVGDRTAAPVLLKPVLGAQGAA
jgi:phosphoribosyl 1,2-cyclic phosphodiesterase